MAVELASPPTPKPHRFTRSDYYKMARLGILPPESRVELIDGRILDMSPVNPPHASVARRIARILGRRLGERALVFAQDPIDLGEFDEPQPDVTVVQPRRDEYGTAHPAAADVLLVVEVSHTTLAYDRDVKVPLYSRVGLPETWNVVLAHGEIVTYREPTADGYQVVQTYRRGESLTVAAFPDVTISVDEILG